MPFQIIRNDLTKVKADIIVNSANPRPKVGPGVDSAIYQAAGMEELLEKRKKIGQLRPGQVGLTPAFHLDAKYILHTVGPIWRGGLMGEANALRACYTNCLSLADSLQAESIAFPLISTGNYRFPKDLALNIALESIGSFLLTHEMMIYLVVFDQKSFVLSKSLMGDIDVFIDEHTVSELEALKEKERGGRNFLQELTRPREARLEEEDSSREPGLSHRAGNSKAQFSRLESYHNKRWQGMEEASVFEEEMEEEPEERPSLQGESQVNSPFLQEEEKDSCQVRPVSHMSSKPDYLTEEEEEDASVEEVECCSPMVDREPAPKAEMDFAPEEESFFSPSKSPMPRPTDEAKSGSPDQASELLSGKSLEELISTPSETFQERLFQLIDQSGMDDVTFYKKANIDRKLFSRIRCNRDYHPKKKTALALAIALELDLPTLLDLLGRAEITLSPCSKSDLIISYFVLHKNYNIHEINATLFKYDQTTLGE